MGLPRAMSKPLSKGQVDLKCGAHTIRRQQNELIADETKNKKWRKENSLERFGKFVGY